jgi:uncharacterized protein YqiB (DUF1249 family)
MASDNKRASLEENLASFNEELISNISRLASFIRSYEGGEWTDAQIKAGQLLREKKAIEYIESVRKAVSEGKEQKGSESFTTTVKPSKLPKISRDKTIFEKNYDRLMSIAPGLEEKLINYKANDEIYGKSESRGYMDFNLELLFQEKGGFHLSMSHYFKQNGDMVPDPDMEILVNIENGTIEALHFQDMYHYEEVYDDKISRKRVDKKEQASQNNFLGDWLKNLKRQDHQIKWDEDESTEVPPSIIEDKYKKAEIKKEKTKTVESKSEKSQIETLFGDISVSDGKKCLKQLEKVILFKEGNTLPADKVESRVNTLVKDGSVAPYLFDAIEKLTTLDGGHLMSLNYYKFLDIIPNLVEKLTDENASVELKSTKSELVYTVKFANRLLANVVTYAVYEQNEQKKENATMLIKVRTKEKFATVDHISGNFFDLETYAPVEIDPFQNEYYFASLGFNQWLIALVKDDFSAKWSEQVETVVEPELKIEFHPVEEEESDEFDNDYINKDIPDFEPGHVQLTETHKKYGVTQKVINEINRTLKGKVIVARAKAMIHNTKDKLADLAHQAQMPGFRISKTGKFYFEGRSNRADRTRSGY